MNSVEVTELLVDYGRFRLFLPELEVAQGQVLHIFGANASGKTTLLEAIFGLRTLHQGRISVLGDATDLRATGRISDIAYVSDDGFELFEELTPKEYWTLYSKVAGQADHCTREAERIAQDLHLTDISTPISDLSKGGKRKTQLVCAFMRQPRLYLLDEPQAGLDPVSAIGFDELLASRINSGADTAIIAGHDLTLPDRLPGRCIVLANGRIVFDRHSDEDVDFSSVLRQAIRTTARWNP